MEERKIRIRANLTIDEEEEQEIGPLCNDEIDSAAASFLTSFSADPDTELLKESKKKVVEQKPERNGKSEEERMLAEYQALRSKAISTDLADIEALSMIRVLGQNSPGEKAVVIQGFPLKNNPTDLDFDRYFLYIVKVMDQVASGPFFLVYFHDENVDFSFDWLKRLYQTWHFRFFLFCCCFFL